MSAPTALTPAEARRAARNASILALASIVSKGLLFAWQIVLTRGLGEVAFGIYGTVSGLVQIASTIPNFGMGPIVIRDVARHPAATGRYWTVALVLQTSLAGLAYLGVNAAAALGGFSADVRTFLVIAGLNLIVDILGNMSNDLLLAHEKMRATALVAIGHILALLAFAGGALLLGFGMWGVYLGTLAAGMLRAALLGWLLLQSGQRPAWPFDAALAKMLLWNSTPLALSAFLGVAYAQIDKLLTNRFIGDAETGYLATAFIVIFGTVEVLNTTIFTAAYPLISRAVGDGANALFGNIMARLSFISLYLSLPAVLVIATLSNEVTRIFGARFAPTGDILRLLIWYGLLNIATGSFSYGYMAQNRQSRLLRVRGAGLALNIALLLILLPRLGVHGAAVALILSESFVLVLLFLGFEAAGWERKPILAQVGRLAALGLLTGAALFSLSRLPPLLALALGAAVYLGGTFGLRVLSPADIHLLRQILSAAPGGAALARWLPKR